MPSLPRYGWWTFFRQQRPVEGQGAHEKEFDIEEMLPERALGGVPNLTQVHEVVAQLAFREPVAREADTASCAETAPTMASPATSVLCNVFCALWSVTGERC